MSDWLAHFNEQPPSSAEEELLACCDSRAWARALVNQRPYATASALLEAAEAAWWNLRPADWLHAFAAHPRIGESAGARPQHGAGSRWSASEQKGVAQASDALRAELADVNRRYEQRFGYTYIVCATGKSAEELLRIARERLGNDDATELRVAAAEQAKITRLRLERLLRQELKTERP